MADTLPNVFLPADEWVDLYAETGIPVGTAISVGNIGAPDVRLAVRATKPPLNWDAYTLVLRNTSIPYRNSAGDSGAWALCRLQDGRVNVRRAV